MGCEIGSTDVTGCRLLYRLFREVLYESYSTIKVYNCKKNLPAMRKDSIIFDRALALDVRAWEATRLAPGRLVRSNHASQEKAVAVIFVVKPATVVYFNSLLNSEKTTVIIRKG